MGIEHNTDIVPGEGKTNDVPLSSKAIASPTVGNSSFPLRFKRKYIDTRKLFHPTQEFLYFRFPKIELVNTMLSDVENEKSGHPPVIINHSGTNDLTATTPAEDFTFNISASISQASIKFLKSKIIYPTVLPLADIPLSATAIKNKQETYLRLFKTTQCPSCDS